MKTFWVTYRLKEDDTYNRRRAALHDAIAEVVVNKTWWIEPTSFFMFQAEYSLDQIAQHLESAIATNRDVILIGMIGYKGTRIVGTADDKVVFKFDPDMKQI